MTQYVIDVQTKVCTKSTLTHPFFFHGVCKCCSRSKNAHSFSRFVVPTLILTIASPSCQRHLHWRMDSWYCWGPQRRSQHHCLAVPQLHPHMGWRGHWGRVCPHQERCLLLCRQVWLLSCILFLESRSWNVYLAVDSICIDEKYTFLIKRVYFLVFFLFNFLNSNQVREE